MVGSSARIWRAKQFEETQSSTELCRLLLSKRTKENYYNTLSNRRGDYRFPRESVDKALSKKEPLITPQPVTLRSKGFLYNNQQIQGNTGEIISQQSVLECNIVFCE